MKLHRLGLVAALCTLAGLAVAEDQAEPPEVTAIREMVPELTKRLEKLRGKTFDRPVEVRYQTAEEFEAFMRSKLDVQYSEERARRDVMLLSALGILPQGYDLRQAVVDAMSSQALAHYDPEAGAFFVLKTSMPTEMVAPTVLHELQHALQDQKYDLAAAMKPFEDPDFADEDRALAFKFIVEGEATYLQTLFALEQAGQGRGPMLEMQLKLMGTADRKQMNQLEQMQLGMLPPDQAKAMREALTARAKLPNFLYHQLLDPYNKGALFCYEVVKKHGPEGLDALFENPPTTTEQCLHPEKALGEGRDEPVTLHLADVSEAIGGGAELLTRTTLGEDLLRVLFTELSGGPEVAACAGWDGDRVQAYAAPDAEWASIVWFLTFDSPEDAQEFAAALNAQRKGAPAPLAGADVTVDGADVLVIGGVGADRLDAVKAAVRAGLTRS